MNMRDEHLGPHHSEQPIDETGTEHIDELLDRYFVNNIPPAETDLLRVSLRRAGLDLAKVEHLRGIWGSQRRVRVSAQDRIVTIHRKLNLDISERYNQAFKSVGRTSEIVVTSLSGEPPSSRTHKRAKAMWYTLAAASLAILISIGGWFGGVKSVYANASVYTTAYGQRATIVLPDGTIAVLNVGSRLDVPADYAAGNRNLWLSGEAMFTVKHQAGAPFTVTAGSSVTRVLGTSFMVRHYSTDTAALVVVRDGKVAIGSTVLTANEQALVRPSRDVHVIPAIHSGHFTFATGVLTIDGLLLQDAIVELNRWYDADIRIGDEKLVTQRIKGGFPSGSLGDLTERFEWTFNMRVVRNGRVLTLYSK